MATAEEIGIPLTSACLYWRKFSTELAFNDWIYSHSTVEGGFGFSLRA
jgi:hypothetical protein